MCALPAERKHQVAPGSPRRRVALAQVTASRENWPPGGERGNREIISFLSFSRAFIDARNSRMEIDGAQDSSTYSRYDDSSVAAAFFGGGRTVRAQFPGGRAMGME